MTTQEREQEQGATFEITDLRMVYPIKGGLFRRVVGEVAAVDGVNLTVTRGRVLCVVGESGAGKTTLARVMVRMEEPTDGTVSFSGADLWEMERSEVRAFRRQVQMIFQNPYSSLNPRHTIETIVREPLDANDLGSRRERVERVREVVELVGLGERLLVRYPHELSGGQRQRVAIARALTTSPAVLLCDEPVSALDMSIRAQIINLLIDLKEQLGITYVVISHDLALVRQIADDIAVLYLGRIVEYGSAEDIYLRPSHPYTHALLAAAPRVDTTRRKRAGLLIRGEIPTEGDVGRGCRFLDRCWLASRLGRPEVCATSDPALQRVSADLASHTTACHFPEEARASQIHPQRTVPLPPQPDAQG